MPRSQVAWTGRETTQVFSFQRLLLGPLPRKLKPPWKMGVQEEKGGSAGFGRDSHGAQRGARTGTPPPRHVPPLPEQLMGGEDGGLPSLSWGTPCCAVWRHGPMVWEIPFPTSHPSRLKGKGGEAASVCTACAGQSLQPFSYVLLPGL